MNSIDASELQEMICYEYNKIVKSRLCISPTITGLIVLSVDYPTMTQVIIRNTTYLLCHGLERRIIGVLSDPDFIEKSLIAIAQSLKEEIVNSPIEHDRKAFEVYRIDGVINDAKQILHDRNLERDSG